MTVLNMNQVDARWICDATVTRPAAASTVAASLSVEIDAVLRYHAPIDAVLEMLTDEEYVTTKALAMGALEHDVTIEQSAGGVTINLRRVLPAMVPDNVRKFVGETITVVQTDIWSPSEGDGTHDGTLKAHIDKAPVSIAGSMRLFHHEDGGTLHEVDAKIKARIPMMGSKIEKAVAHVLFMAIRKEEQVAESWLSERGHPPS